MIRQAREGEENEIRKLLAILNYEDQFYWRKQARTLDEHLKESMLVPISAETKSKNVILVAEEGGDIVGMCWCIISDREVDKQAEVAEFYVEKAHRGRGIGRELINAARQLFVDEKVDVAFAWTHRGNEAAIRLYENAGFSEVDQKVMALNLSKENKT